MGYEVFFLCGKRRIVQLIKQWVQTATSVNRGIFSPCCTTNIFHGA